MDQDGIDGEMEQRDENNGKTKYIYTKIGGFDTRDHRKAS
jgi:hypothetical protein